MNDSPLITISLRIERGSFFELEKTVKTKGLSKSEFMRKLVNKAIYPGIGSDGTREQNENPITHVQQSNGR
ncbi:MAG: hypothetical protein WCP85_03345 [Mariniphaga sp.]